MTELPENVSAKAKVLADYPAACVQYGEKSDVYAISNGGFHDWNGQDYYDYISEWCDSADAAWINAASRIPEALPVEEPVKPPTDSEDNAARAKRGEKHYRTWNGEDIGQCILCEHGNGDSIHSFRTDVRERGETGKAMTVKILPPTLYQDPNNADHYSFTPFVDTVPPATAQPDPLSIVAQCPKCAFEMTSDGWLKCPRCGEPRTPTVQGQGEVKLPDLEITESDKVLSDKHFETGSAQYWSDLVCCRERQLFSTLRKLDEVAKENGAASAMMERDRTALAHALTLLDKVIQSREWLGESRGCYEWDDDRWHDEFKATAEEIMAGVDGLRKIAADWTGCPKDSISVQTARMEWKTRAEAAESKLDEAGREITRMMDLIRHQRYELLDANLISEDEFAALVADANNGKRVARLETYDSMRADLAKLLVETSGEKGGE